jgi:hypothetical protein
MERESFAAVCMSLLNPSYPLIHCSKIGGAQKVDGDIWADSSALDSRDIPFPVEPPEYFGSLGSVVCPELHPSINLGFVDQSHLRRVESLRTCIAS